jgi:HEPN domain-containing protein
MAERHERWLAMARNDLDFAALGLDHGFFSQTCFLSQQASEKALIRRESPFFRYYEKESVWV